MKDWQVMQCGHCGNRTYFEIRAEYARTEDHLNEDNTVSPYVDHHTWYILECLSCKGMAFFQEYEMTDRETGRVQMGGGGIRYPQVGVTLMNVPTSVIRAYEEARAVRYASPRACAVMAGVTLEALCKEEQVPGNTLASKLKQLADSGRIPAVLAQMAQQLRQIRNLGAHAAEGEVTKEDVPIILEFVEAILEYVYVAPARVATVEQRLKRASGGTSE